MTQEELYEEARSLFKAFEEDKLAVDLFRFKLIELSVKAVNEGIFPVDMYPYFLECLLSQFNSYTKNKNECGYLLSVNSSGSFLTQFEPYYED